MKYLESIVKAFPVLEVYTLPIYRRWKRFKRPSFLGSQDYWIQRYRSGGTSGDGSYGLLAKFKADILNKFVDDHNVLTIIEHGFGDGAQLELAKYPKYMGFDISPECVMLCKNKFSEDNTKTFMNSKDYSGQTAQLSISLDVIYHLVEDGIYNDYMNRLFQSADNYVAIYSSNKDNNSPKQAAHVKHRILTSWIERYKPEWQLISHIPNKYPVAQEKESPASFADFYFYINTNN